MAELPWPVVDGGWIWKTALVVLVGCAGPSPSPPPPPPSPQAAPAPPVDAAPAPPVDTSELEIGFVSVFVAYRSGGRDVFQDVDEYEPLVAECFDRTIPVGRRAPVVYYVHVYVPNPAVDPEAATGLARDAGSGILYPERGTYPELEACVAAAIPRHRAPRDVSSVEVRMHIHTRATAKGSIGRGRGTRP